MPDAPPQPWIVPRPATPKGELSAHRFESKILGNTRTIRIYTPAGFSSVGPPYPLLVFFDAATYAGPLATPTALDNLIAAKRIPPVVAVMVHNLSEEMRFQEFARGPAFPDFLNSELIPWVRKEYHATTDPRQTVIGGLSLSGFEAVYTALLHPETFGNAISQSGTLQWAPPFARGKGEKIDFNADQNWLAQQFIQKPALPIRFYLEAGSMERLRSGEGNLEAARRMRDVLQARGYSVFYNEFYGAHDDINWRETLPEALIRLLHDAR